jgi:hypothetical protein
MLFSDDSTLSDTRSAFFATGRGNRKQLGHVPVTNKLLLQVFLIKEEGHKSWKETESFLGGSLLDI